MGCLQATSPYNPFSYFMNFLYNMFGGRNSKLESSKYDRISFKINLSEHIPQYYQSWNNKVPQETELTPDSPLYYELFPKEKENYIEYTAKEDDTLFGIAIKLDISEKFIREINDISGNLYPGMTVKLPPGTDLSLLEAKEEPEHVARLRISQLLSSEKTNTINHKYTVHYYAGLSGDIKGVLTVNSNYIIFNPLLEEEENLARFTVEKLLKFNVLVEMMDIQRAEYMRLPQIDGFTGDGEPKYNSVVQFMLYKVGNIKIERKYKERLKQLKLDHKAIASITFSFKEEERSAEVCEELTQVVNQIIQESEAENTGEEQKKRLTNIPFFDIINDSLQKEEKPQQQNKIIAPNAILGSITEESDIITPEHFENLARGFPILYKLYNWTKSYSARRDGSAFNTFLSKCANEEPAIFLVKEYKGNILGAFLVESLQAGKTGRGEMFIFTFRDGSTVPEIYEWTAANEFFVYLEKEQGIGIGMGVNYGIFVDRNLEKGSSASTNTFGNKERLSKKEDFLVDEIELWGVDTSY